jgi:hypothetical protein
VDILLLLMVFGWLVVFALDTGQELRARLCQQVVVTKRKP